MPAADQMANDQESGIGFADRPYGDASRIDKSLKAMTTMGGGDTPLAPLAPVQSPDAVERNALASVVAPGTPAQYKSQFAPDVTAAQRMYESGAGITAPRPGGLPQAAGDLLGAAAGVKPFGVDWLNPLHDLATAYGETVDPLLGLIEKTAGDKAAQQAYLANLHTLDGGDPAAVDFFATTRALRAAHQAAQDEAAAIANDPNAPPLIRWLSALQNAADITAQFTLPVPGVGEIGASVKALRGARGADVVRGPISPAEMELARAEPVTVLTPPETLRVELGGPGSVPVAAQVVRGTNVGMRPWELSPDQLDTAIESTKAADKNIEASLFGADGAKEYARLQAIANSTSGARSAAEMDAASARIQEMENSLTKSQQDRLFGIGESGPQAADLTDFRSALGRVGGDTPGELGRSLRWALTKVGDKTDPALMTHTEQVAYAQIRHAMDYAQQAGWDLKDVSRAAVNAAGERFGPDAEFMLKRYLGPKGIEAAQGAPSLAQQPLGSRIVARSAEQQAAEAGNAAATVAQEAKAPGASAGVIGRTASGPDIVGNLNLDRVTQDPAIKSIYRATYNGDPTAFEAAMGHGPRAERVAEAQVIVHNALMSGTTPADYVASVAEKAQKPAEVGAARLMVDIQTDKAWKATQEYHALRDASLDPASGASVDPVALRQAALDATKAVLDQFAVQKDIAGVASKAGQTLDMFNQRLNAIDRLSASGTDTSVAFGSAMKLIFGVDELAKQTAFVKALVDLPATDHIGISALIRTILEDPAYKAAPAVNFGWWVNHLRVNALMSPLTFARVAASNVWKIGTTPIELYGVTAAQGVAHALTGAERSTSLAATNAFTKTLATTGVARGLSAGLYSFLHNISVKQLLYDETGAVSITAPQGVSPLNREFYKPISPPGMRYPGKQGGVVGTAGARVADVTGIIGRTISAIETAFRESLVPAHLAMDGARKAESMGLKHGSPEYMAVVQKYINDPTYSVAQQAALFAREYTFNSKNPGVKTAAFLDLRNKIPLGNAIVPFANAPSHIFRDFIQQTPFGLPPVAKLQYKLTGGKIGEMAPQGISTAKGMDTGMPALGHETESAMRYARAVKGTLAAAWIVNQMQAGNIRGLNPYQYGTTEYDIWNKQGPEFSIQTPAGWLTLDAIQPIGRMIRTAGAWEQGIATGKGEITPQAVAHAVIDVARTQFDESWFSSVSALNDMLAGKVGGNTAQADTAWSKFVSNLASQAIPLSGTLRVINHAMGGNTKDPRGFSNLSDYLTANLPLLSRAVPDRMGLGGPERPTAGGGPGAVSPINLVRNSASDVENTLLALKQHGYTIPEPSLTNSSAGRGAQYSDADLASLRNLAYPRMLDAINAAVHDPGWSKLDEAQQAKMLATKVDAVRTEVKFEFARDTLINSSDQKTIIRGALSGLATQNTFGEKALWIGYLDKSGKLTPDVVKAIEDSAKVVLPGQTPEKPVAEYRKAAPLVRAFLEIPPFRSGNEAEWAAYAQAREERLDIEADMKAKNNGKAPSAFTLENAIRQQNPQMATLLAKYDANLMADPRRAALIKANPWLSPFVASFQYTQHPTGTIADLPAATTEVK